MTRMTKRIKSMTEKLGEKKTFAVEEAFKTLSELSAVKFVESIDVSLNLGVDAKKSDQAVRGSVVLPHGTGKTVRVAAFAQGANADKAKEAGADEVGFEELAEKIKAGDMNFDVVVATPDAMKVVGKLGTVLGPKGLMPNPKDGTVSADIAAAVKNAKAGQVRFRTDKNGIIHCTIGKVNFSEDHLKENLKALVDAVKKLKPTSSKGIYLKKLTISSTMGPGLTVDTAGM
ncbi:MAG: 50S ribosomal protein L1 [Gammaproteobacteria bacterium]